MGHEFSAEIILQTLEENEYEVAAELVAEADGDVLGAVLLDAIFGQTTATGAAFIKDMVAQHGERIPSAAVSDGFFASLQEGRTDVAEAIAATEVFSGMVPPEKLRSELGGMAGRSETQGIKFFINTPLFSTEFLAQTLLEPTSLFAEKMAERDAGLSYLVSQDPEKKSSGLGALRALEQGVAKEVGETRYGYQVKDGELVRPKSDELKQVEKEDKREIRRLRKTQKTRLTTHAEEREAWDEERGETAEETGEELSKKIRQEELRASNPEGLEQKRSFGEMVEDAYHQDKPRIQHDREGFNGIIEMALDEWGMSREQLCEHMAGEHSEGRKLTNTVLYQWKNEPEHHPNRDTMGVFMDAFDLDRTQELMMWKVAAGRDAEVEITEAIGAAEQAIGKEDEKTMRGELTKLLQESSGVPVARVEEILEVQQMMAWKKGARIENLEMGQEFTSLMNPVELAVNEAEQNMRADQNERIERVLGGRVADIYTAAEEAQSAKNSGGKLLSLLTGRTGLVPLSEAELSEMLGVSSHKAKKMRSSGDARGAHIDEGMAEIIADRVQGIDADKRHLMTIEERADREILLDGLTGVPTPVALFTQYKKGEIELGEVMVQTRARRGDNQMKGAGGFERGEETVGHERAGAFADYLGFTGEAFKETRREFMVAATGKDASLTPEEILGDIRTGNMERHIGLRRLLDLTGMPRAEFAESIKENYHTVESWVTEERGGYIADMAAIPKVARAVGLAEQVDDVKEIFSMTKERWHARDDRGSEHQNTVSASRQEEHWPGHTAS